MALCLLTVARAMADFNAWTYRREVTFNAATVTITAGNGGSGINLVGSGFTCDEGYNVFHDDTLMVNGAPLSPAATSSTGNPLFVASGAKPVPWYALGAKASSAWESALDGTHRGAWQGSIEPRGTLIMLR